MLRITNLPQNDNAIFLKKCRFLKFMEFIFLEFRN